MELLSSTELGAHQALSMAESILASPKVEPSPRNHNTAAPAPLPLDLPAAASNPVSPAHSTSRSSNNSTVSDHISSSSSTPSHSHSHSQTLHSSSSRRALSPTSVSSLSSSPSSPSPLSPTSSSTSYSSSSSAAVDDHCVLFLGDLSRSVSEDGVSALFAMYGDVVSVDVKRDKMSGHNLGYGFVQLATRQQAEAAKRMCHGAGRRQTSSTMTMTAALAG